MKQIRKSLWILLTHSYATLASIVVLMLVLIVLQNYNTEHMSDNKAYQMGLIINITVMSFLGIYLGSALLKMKQYYLWKMHSTYRISLITAFVIITLIAALMLMPFQLKDSFQISSVFVISFCLAFYSAFIVLGKSKLHQLVIMAIPFGLYQLKIAGVDEGLVLILLAISTMFLINYMFQENSYGQVTTGELFSVDALVSTSTKSLFMTKINHQLGLLVIKWILKSKKDLSWAIFTPQTKIGLGALFNVALIAVFYLFTNDEKFPFSSMLMLFFITSLFAIIIESRNNIAQTKKFAHIFSGNNHRYLKNQILFSVDKMMVFTGLVFYVASLLLIKLLGAKFEFVDFSLSILATLLLTLAYHPILMSIKWIKVTWALIIFTVIYAVLAMLTNAWINSSLIGEFNVFAVIAFIIIGIAIRGFTESVFTKKSMEILFRN